MADGANLATSFVKCVLIQFHLMVYNPIMLTSTKLDSVGQDIIMLVLSNSSEVCAVPTLRTASTNA